MDACVLQSADVNDQRWGFEDADDWEYEQLSSKQSPGHVEEPAETLVGQDPDGLVTVVVSREGEVVEVRLSPGWRRSVDPRGLHSNVLSAANTATMRALAYNVERIEIDSTAVGERAEPGPDADQSPLSRQQVQRLLEAVSMELDDFTARLSTVADHPVQVQSAGGHVQGSAQRGQVLWLDIETAWAGQARHTEIEHELVEVLRGLHNSSTSRALAAGPTGSAISELMELAADPRRLMRRLGMPD
jgi:DNA-binding protein YbaB